MNETQARAAIRATMQQIVADWTDYILAVEPDGQAVVDQATQTLPYLKMWIDMMGGGQASIEGDNPLVEYRGQLEIQIVVKEGTGTIEATTLRDFVGPYFSCRSLAGALHFHAAEPYKEAPIKGWVHYPLLVNFWWHSLAH